MISRPIARLFVVLICLLLSSSRLAAQNPVPFVNQPLVPTAAAPGGATFTLTVNGTGFASGATVQWNGSARATTFVNSSQLTASILAGDIATAGTATVTVVNPTPGGGPSNPVFFPVTNAATNVAFERSAPLSSIATGDFTGTRKLDLLLNSFWANSSGVVSVGTITFYPGNGDGTFQPSVGLQVAPAADASYFRGIAVGDFNGDGKLDVIVIRDHTPPNAPAQVASISVLLGNGDGTFQPFIETMLDANYVQLETIRLADLNGDGKLDLVTRCLSGTIKTWGICVNLGNGDGTFSPHPAFTFFSPTLGNINGNPPFIGVESVAIGDFNADGKLDIAIASDPAYVALLLGNGNGTFGSPNVILETFSRAAGTLAAADFNHDGKLDLVHYHDECANQGSGPCSGNLDYLAGNGDGTFQAALTINGLPDPITSGLGGLGQPLNPPFVADLNGDGILDLIVADQVFILGNGSYRQYSLPAPVLFAGDFNRDGKIDLAGPSGVFLQTPPAPDFQLSAPPPFLNVVTGSSASFTLTITAIDGFAGTVQPSLAGLPAGANVSFNPPTVTGSGSIVVTITASNSTATGTYSLFGSLTSGSITHSGGFLLNVGPAGTDFTDFTGTINPTYRNLAPGDTGTYQIQVQPLSGFTGNVSFSLSGLPSGTTASFNPPTVTGGSGSTTLTVQTSASTPNGQYSLVLTSTSGSKTHSTTIVLNVNPSGTYFGDFTGGITPTSQTIRVGQTANFVVTIQPLYGYNADTYIDAISPSPLPTGLTGSANPNPILPRNGSFSSTVTFQTDARLQPGTYTITLRARGITLTGPFIIHTGTITLTVTP